LQKPNDINSGLMYRSLQFVQLRIVYLYERLILESD